MLILEYHFYRFILKHITSYSCRFMFQNLLPPHSGVEMDNTRSMIISQNCDNGGVAPWSDLNHDVLFLVTMRLGVFDFIAIRGVCKSWRSFALLNGTRVMEPKPPMFMCISDDVSEKECTLKDLEGRKFKTILPHSAGRTCVGLTCGYLILFGRETNDFWLVNPITRHELHFPNVPFSIYHERVRAILVFLPSISQWVFVMTSLYEYYVTFCIEGAWNHACYTWPLLDLHAFKGKIYTLHTKRGVGHVCEMRLDPHPTLTLLETKNIENLHFPLKFVSWSGQLEVVECRLYGDLYTVHELDFEEMKWVCHENTREHYAYFLSLNGDISKWFARQIHFWRYDGTNKIQKGRFNYAKMWYFPHDCLNVNIIDE